VLLTLLLPLCLLCATWPQSTSLGDFTLLMVVGRPVLLFALPTPTVQG
jgi:hypothetical protein